MKDNKKIDCKKKDKKIMTGLILLSLGFIFLLNNYGFTNIDIARLWPIFLIIPGLFMLLSKQKEN